MEKVEVWESYILEKNLSVLEIIIHITSRF